MTKWRCLICYSCWRIGGRAPDGLSAVRGITLEIPDSGHIDSELQYIVHEWARLSSPVKAGILAMVKASEGEG